MNMLCDTCKHKGIHPAKIPCLDCDDGDNYEKHDETFQEFMIRKGKEEEKRPKMLPNPAPNYERDSSKYPDSVRISFKDGHTAVYDIRIEQPAPVIIENIKIIRKWKQGYVNKPMRRRNRT